MRATTEAGQMVEEVFETEGALLAAFLKGCADVGFGAVISFEPNGSQLDGSIVSIVQHKGDRFSGGDIRMGRGITVADAIADLTAEAWQPGVTLEQAEVDGLVL